jgi:GTP-binding protein HflX
MSQATYSHMTGAEEAQGEKQQNETQRDAQGLISTGVRPERALLAQLIFDEVPRARLTGTQIESGHAADDEASPEESLEELAGLAEAAGAEVVGSATQKRSRRDPATLFGKGKVSEIGELCRDLEADVVIVDCDLTPAQGRNLEKTLDTRVIDRTELILDIFARRARTKQAKLQVELAQLRYQLPRLKRMWTHLDSLSGGGVGLRGPGETQLETDRRLAGDRIALLERQLSEIRRQKQVESEGRLDFEGGALVGYTNVGKSALLNALSNPTGKQVLVANQLFATLGASTRRIPLGGGRDVLLSDTVGFVRRLPHHLVECFHSTLAEVQNADFLLMVTNAADEELDEKLSSVREVLGTLESAETPTVLVLNQCDRLSEEERAVLQAHHPDAIMTSALTGEGLDDLRARIREVLEQGDEEIALTLDAGSTYTGKLLSDLAKHGRILQQEWGSDENGDKARIYVRARLPQRWREKLEIPDSAVRRS